MNIRILAYLFFLGFSGVCVAQTFYGSPSTQKPAPAPSTSFSAEDYQKSVKSLGTQNDAALTQTVKQQLTTQAPPIPVITPAPVPKAEITTTPTTAPSTPASVPAPPITTTTPSTPATVPVPPVTTTPAVTPQAVTPVTAPAAVTPTVPTPVKEPQSQIYTGFGGGDEKKTQDSSKEKSASWNIQY